MALRTRLTELLGIEHPIIQGGMAWTATAELAAAVSNAGGIGIIGAGHMPTEVLRSEIRRAKAAHRQALRREPDAAHPAHRRARRDGHR